MGNPDEFFSSGFLFVRTGFINRKKTLTLCPVKWIDLYACNHMKKC